MKVFKIDSILFRRILVCCAGVLMTSLSAALFYLVKLGSDPFQAFVTGLNSKLHLSYGLVINLINAGAAIFMFLFAKKFLKAAFFINVLLFGTLVDGYILILGRFLNPDLPLAVRVFVGAAACLIMSAGVYLYLLPSLGAGPTEAIGLLIAEKARMPYGRIRILTDIIYTAIGALWGGNVGIITVIAVVTTGPMVGLLNAKFQDSRLARAVACIPAEK